MCQKVGWLLGNIYMLAANNTLTLLGIQTTACKLIYMLFLAK